MNLNCLTTGKTFYSYGILSRNNENRMYVFKYLFLKNPPPEMPLFTPKLAHVVNIKNTKGSKNYNYDNT